MTKEEQLKIYSAYLPYEVAFSDLTCDMPNKIILDTENFSGVLEDATHLNTIRLHLYDLTYLTKEIEHEGETFVPIEKIFEVQHWTYIDKEKWLTSIKKDYKILPVNVYESLLRWHFNVFNLPEGDFINKATLTNK